MKSQPSNNLHLRTLLSMLCGLFGWGLITSSAFAVPVDPATLSGRILHHRADQGVFTDVGGTSAATNGQAVRHWADQSSSNSDATNGVGGAQQPLYVTGAFPVNNLPALQFDGSNDYLAQALDLNAGAKSIFAVYQSNGITSGTFNSLFSFRDSSANLWTEVALGNAVGGYADATFVMDMLASTTSRGLSSITSNTAGHLLGLTYNGGSITSNASFGARYDTSSSTVVASGAFGRSITDSGAIGYRLGANTLAYNGLIGEIVVFDRELNASEFSGVQEFLYNKYFVLAPVILPVPEPGSFCLLGGGCLGLTWLRHRARCRTPLA